MLEVYNPFPAHILIKLEDILPFDLFILKSDGYYRMRMIKNTQTVEELIY